MLCPDPEFVEDSLEFAARARGMVFPAPSGGIGTALDHPGGLESPETRHEEALGDPAHPVLDLAEVVTVEQDDLPEDQRRPTFRNDLARE